MKYNCGSALIAHVIYVRVMFQSQAIVFHAVIFSPVFSPILDTVLSLVSVVYQVHSQRSNMLRYVSIIGEGVVLVKLY